VDLQEVNVSLAVACSAFGFVFGAGVAVGVSRQLFGQIGLRLSALEQAVTDNNKGLAALSAELARIDERTRRLTDDD